MFNKYEELRLEINELRSELRKEVSDRKTLQEQVRGLKNRIAVAECDHPLEERKIEGILYDSRMASVEICGRCSKEWFLQDSLSERKKQLYREKAEYYRKLAEGGDA